MAQVAFNIAGALSDVAFGPIVYAAPSGDNSSGTGTDKKPFKTGSRAWTTLLSSGGGTLMWADNTAWCDGSEGISGLTAGQGMWIHRGGSTSAPPGFLGVPNGSIEVRGTGGANFTQFPMGSWARMNCGGGIGGPGANNRFDPMIWFRGNSNTSVKFVGIGGGNRHQVIRGGWDYPRDTSGNIVLSNVGQAARSSGSTTFTVSLPAYSITRIGRGGGSNVTVNVNLGPYMNFLPIAVGSVVRIAGVGSPDFPDVDAVVSTFPGAFGGLSFGYVQAGANVTLSGAAGTLGTASTHGAVAGDFIELVSTDVNWPSSMYRVTASTVTTITCADPYGGYGGRSAAVTTANIGTYALQDRNSYASSFVIFENFAGTIDAGDLTDRFTAGPAIDWGSTAAGPWMNFVNGFVGGYDIAGAGCPDRYRRMAYFINGGGKGASNVVITGPSNRTSIGGIYVIGGKSSWGCDIENVQCDVPIGATNDTVCFIEGNTSGDVVLRRIYNNDGVSPSVGYTGMAYPQIRTYDCGVVDDTSTGGWIVGEQGAVDRAFTYAARDRLGIQGQTLTARIPNLNFGPTSAGRYQNLIGEGITGTWDTVSGPAAVVTALGASDGPWGRSGAVRLTGGGAAITTVAPRSIDGIQYSGTVDARLVPSVGDRIFFSVWVRPPSGTGLAPANGRVCDIGYNGGTDLGTLQVSRDFVGLDGWTHYLVVGNNKITSVSAPGEFRVWFYVTSTLTLDIWNPVLFKVNVADGIGNDEYAMWRWFSQGYPARLAAGEAGTWPGQNFLVGGRLKQNQATSTAAAGTLTLPSDGDYFPITGATTINYITTSGWSAGNRFVLAFSGTPTVTHNAAAAPAGTANIKFASGASYSSGGRLRLAYNGTNFEDW